MRKGRYALLGYTAQSWGGGSLTPAPALQVILICLAHKCLFLPLLSLHHGITDLNRWFSYGTNDYEMECLTLFDDFIKGICALSHQWGQKFGDCLRLTWNNFLDWMISWSVLVIIYLKIYISRFDGSSQMDIRFYAVWGQTVLELGALRKVKEHPTCGRAHTRPQSHIHSNLPKYPRSIYQAFIPLLIKSFYHISPFPLCPPPPPPLLHLYDDKNSIRESLKGGYFLSFLIYFLLSSTPSPFSLPSAPGLCF